MEELFRQQCNIHSARGIDLDAVMKAVLHLARKHEVCGGCRVGRRRRTPARIQQQKPRRTARRSSLCAARQGLAYKRPPAPLSPGAQVSIDSNYAALVVGICVIGAREAPCWCARPALAARWRQRPLTPPPPPVAASLPLQSALRPPWTPA